MAGGATQCYQACAQPALPGVRAHGRLWPPRHMGSAPQCAFVLLHRGCATAVLMWWWFCVACDEFVNPPTHFRPPRRHGVGQHCWRRLRASTGGGVCGEVCHVWLGPPRLAMACVAPAGDGRARRLQQQGHRRAGRCAQGVGRAGGGRVGDDGGPAQGFDTPPSPPAACVVARPSPIPTRAGYVRPGGQHLLRACGTGGASIDVAGRRRLSLCRLVGEPATAEGDSYSRISIHISTYMYIYIYTSI